MHNDLITVSAIADQGLFSLDASAEEIGTQMTDDKTPDSLPDKRLLSFHRKTIDIDKSFPLLQPAIEQTQQIGLGTIAIKNDQRIRITADDIDHIET